MTYYLYSVARATRRPGRERTGRRLPVADATSRLQTWWSNPWGKPRFLVLFTWAYVLWSLVPVAIAVLFGFNAGRSRSTWQGFRSGGTTRTRTSLSCTTRRCATLR